MALPTFSISLGAGTALPDEKGKNRKLLVGPKYIDNIFGKI